MILLAMALLSAPSPKIRAELPKIEAANATLSGAVKLLVADGRASGIVVAQHEAGTPVTERAPARRLETVTLFATGLSQRTVGSISISIGDRIATIVRIEPKPNSHKIYQIAVQVPSQVVPSAPPVSLQVGSARSESGVWLPLKSTGGREYFVAPEGKVNAAGTRHDPWDLQTALKQPPGVVPGTTIWLLGGRYGKSNTYFFAKLIGTEDKPIIVRQMPGERATIDGSLIVNGANAWYWGFEVTSSFADRTGDRFSPAAGTLDGLDINGPGTRFINLVVHDTRAGFGLWTPAVGSEIYGSLIYHNGWQGPDRGHGHGIYTQNQTGHKHLGDNIIFNHFGMGIQAYGSEKAYVQNFLVDYNIVFNNGVISRDGRTDNVLFGFSGPLRGIRIENNYTYHTPTASIGGSRIGWQYGERNQDAVVTGNYFIGGYFAVELWNWAELTFARNTTYSENSAALALYPPSPPVSPIYHGDKNNYYGSDQFFLKGALRNWREWKTNTQFDRESIRQPGRPSGTWVFAHPNKYEPGRGNIVIYNWDLKPAVPVDVSTILRPDDQFEVRDAQNFFGPPVSQGTYRGGLIEIPMKNLRVASPLGTVPHPPQHTAPEFGAFVILTQ